MTSTGRAALLEKMRKRRELLKDTYNDDLEPSPRRPTSSQDTWGAAMEDTAEVVDETKDSETLVKDLKHRRKQKQKELHKVLESKDDEPDVKAEIRSARKKAKQKVLDEAQRQREQEEAEEGSSQVMTLGSSVEDVTDSALVPPTEDAGPSSASSTARSVAKKPPRSSLLSVEDAVTAAMSASGGATPRRVSKNLSQSIRDRLSERVRKAKDKGETEGMSETLGGRTLAGLRSQTRSTRFDDPSLTKRDSKSAKVMSKEEYEAEVMLERSMSLRSRWKKAAGKVTSKGPVLPTAEEAYDFFTRNWDPDPEEAAAAEPKAAEPEDTAPSPEGAAAEGEEPQPGTSDEVQEGAEPAKEAEEEEEEGKPKKGKAKGKKGKETTEEEEPLLGEADEGGGGWRMYEVGKAVYRPHQQVIEDEENTFFSPSMRPIPATEKIFGKEQPRYLEDEGFYVGVRPDVPTRNQNRLEHRLLSQRDKGEKWFGEDGRVLSLPDPVREIPYRPTIPEEPIPELQADYIKAVTVDYDSKYIDGSMASYGQYQLDVDINTIWLTHHHLFSREHVLASRLTQQYNQYVSRSRKKVVDFLTEKLRALKSAALHVQENIANLKAGRAGVTFADQENRLTDYKLEVRQTRRQRDEEMKSDRTLLRNIIKTWKDIKALRELQQCNNTTIKLQIRKEPTTKTEDEAEWDMDIEEEFDEIREQQQEEYEKQLAVYEGLLEEWKKQKLAKKDALKRQKKRDKRIAKGEDIEGNEEEIEQMEEDSLLLQQEDVAKPEKPKPWDTQEKDLKDKIREKYMDIRRRPGEPKLYPELSNGATITPIHQCPRGEQQRRNEVDRHKLFVKVLFNNKEVSRTTSKQLNQDFKVTFAQIFNVQIVQWPESIKMQIFEGTVLSSSLLAEVYTPIPEANVISDSVQLEDMEFSSDLKMSHNHEGVGSGVAFSFASDNSQSISLLTTGHLSTSVSWAVDEAGNVLVPPGANQANQFQSAMKGMDPVAAIGVSGMADMDKLTKWITESRLDPNDPSNADLMYLMRPVGGGDAFVPQMRLPEHFRLDHLQQEFDLATDEEIESSRRFRLIQLREQEIPEFKTFKMVPALDKEVSQDTFEEYEKKQKEEEKIRKMDDVESHRANVAKFMQRVREAVMLRFRAAAHQKTLQDMVFEDVVPNIGTILPNLLKMTEPRRPLKPIRKERKKVTAQNLQGMDVKILANIVRAFDIPVREEAVKAPAPRVAQPTQPGVARQPTGNLKNIAGETLVRPYVEVTFQRNSIATSVADGPNPSWNEELQIPFRAPNNDYSSTNLQTVHDELYFSIFDEYIIDVLQDDRDRGTSIHRRIEKRWLGSLKIPFSTIYFNSRIDGTFRIDKPPVLLGYTVDTRKGGGANQGVDIGYGEADQTYLTMFITIEPQLSPAEPVHEKFESNEDSKLLQYGDSWLADLEKKFDKREYKYTVVDINGKSVFICRYFKALKPPEELLGEGGGMKSVARFVSMIPFVSDSVVFPGLCDIWSTCDQFLQMLQGDEEEHAVLLTNFFLSMGKTAYLLLGSAIPEGPTAYVLTKEANDYWIWNASTGEHYSYQNNYCPVQSVGCLVNHENIWANIQQTEQPCRISFDLSNTAHWKAFFNKSFPSPGLSSVQPESLIYTPTDRTYVLDLQDKIERTLKEKMMGWRPRHITRWNRYCMQAFRALLQKLEDNKGKGMQPQDQSAELEQILGSYKLSGFPINLPYTEMEPIIESVYATGVHNNESSDVEFALATHIHAYPNCVLSVWVYVASLTRKR